MPVRHVVPILICHFMQESAMQHYLILRFSPCSINMLMPGNIINSTMQTMHIFVQPGNIERNIELLSMVYHSSISASMISSRMIQVARHSATTIAELERCRKRRIESCETQIQQIEWYPKSHQKGELAKWQSQKSIAERRLKNPLSTTNVEKSYFRRYYSFKF